VLPGRPLSPGCAGARLSACAGNAGSLGPSASAATLCELPLLRATRGQPAAALHLHVQRWCAPQWRKVSAGRSRHAGHGAQSWAQPDGGCAPLPGQRRARTCGAAWRAWTCWPRRRPPSSCSTARRCLQPGPGCVPCNVSSSMPCTLPTSYSSPALPPACCTSAVSCFVAVLMVKAS